MKMGEGGDVDALMNKMDKLQTELDAIDGWEIDRQLGRAMEALRCPSGNQRSTASLLCKLRMHNHLVRQAAVAATLPAFERSFCYTQSQVRAGDKFIDHCNELLHGKRAHVSVCAEELLH